MQEILHAIDSRRDEIIDLTRRLVQTESITPTGSEEEIVRLLQAELEQRGISDIQILAKKPERPNILARINGDPEGKTLIFNGHVDTKDIGDRSAWSADPLGAEIIDGVMYGRGVGDMKGAVAAMLIAASVLKAADVDLKGNLLLMFTADEEGGSNFGTKYIVEEVGLKADAAIIGEPSGIDAPYDSLCIAHRGVFCFKIKVYGTQMHSSMSDIRKSVNACVKLAEVLLAFSKEFKLSYEPHPLYPRGPTINLAVLMEGGVFYGVYPGEAAFACDVRVIPGMTHEGAKKDLSSFVNALRRRDPELRIEVDFVPRSFNWAPAVEISPEEPIVESTLAAAESVLGYKPKVAGFPGGTDARLMIQKGGIPTISALGPGMLELAHGPDERVPVEDIVKGAKIYALTAMNYLGAR